jgi:hypothetical protein
MICDSRFHRGRDAQRFANPAEIVVREVNAVRGQRLSHFLLNAFAE